MKRSLGWVLLVAAGLLLGIVSSSYQTTHADPPADEAAGATVAKSDNLNAAMLEELKGIHDQLKEINSQLKTGVIKTFAVMNLPDEKKD
jgi:hypothetical protein